MQIDAQNLRRLAYVCVYICRAFFRKNTKRKETRTSPSRRVAAIPDADFHARDVIPQSAYLRQQSESAIVAVGAASGQSLYRCTQWWIIEETQGGLVARAEYVRVLRQQEVVGLLQAYGQSLQHTYFQYSV